MATVIILFFLALLIPTRWFAAAECGKDCPATAGGSEQPSGDGEHTEIKCCSKEVYICTESCVFKSKYNLDTSKIDNMYVATPIALMMGGNHYTTCIHP